MLLVSPTFAADTLIQPLTRADCDKAGMSWDDAANVCDSKAAAPKVEAAPQTAHKAEAVPQAEGAKPKAPKVSETSKKSAYKKRSTHRAKAQAKPVENRLFKWLFRKQAKPAGKS